MKNIILTISLVLLLTACTQIESYQVDLNKGNDIIYTGDTWIDGGCDITINEELYPMKLSNSPDTTLPGEYDLVYTYTFASQEFTCNRIVKVLNSNYPVVILNLGLDTVYKGETHIDAGITVVDDQEEDCIIMITNTVDESRTGSYTITYEVTDFDGNQTIITRIVNVTTN